MTHIDAYQIIINEHKKFSETTNKYFKKKICKKSPIKKKLLRIMSLTNNV